MRMTRWPPLFLLLIAAGEASAQVSSAAPVTDMGSSLFQLFLGLGGVIGLMVGSLWLLKKLTAQRGEAAGLMRVVAGTAVGARERVVIVEVGSTWLVLGVAPGRVSALAEIPRQTLPTAGLPTENATKSRAESIGRDFADRLRQFVQKK
jgi:flagellar protein FliO/FliZ